MQSVLPTVLIIVLVLIVTITLIVIDKRAKHKLQDELENSKEEKQVMLDFLHLITEDIAKGTDKDTICKRLVRATAFSCGAMSACMYEKRKNVFVPVAEEGLFPPLRKKLEKDAKFSTRCDFLEAATTPEILPAENTIVSEVYNSGKPVFIRNAVSDPRIISHRDDSLKIRSFIAVPIMFLGKKYGVLIAVNPINQKGFSQTSFTLAKSLGDQGGLAFYNLDGISALVAKSKIESDLRLASSVQHYLLPKELPNNDNISIAVKYFPHQLIGGDGYDIIKLPNGKIGVVIADVSGKGISAALLMAVTQSKLHYIAKQGYSPIQTLKILNKEIINLMRTDMFVTLTFAVIENDASKITIARAGHEKPIIYKADKNECFEPKSSGMAVGMVEPEIFDETIEEVEITLDKNDIIVLYTDGITEATNDVGEEYSTKRLTNSIIKNATSETAENFNDKIIKDLKTFTGTSAYNDDLTLLSIKKI